MNYKTITVQDEDSIRIVTLQRPERRNAMTAEMQTELIAAFEAAATSGARVLVLSGSGSAFCSGLDLSELQQMQSRTEAEHRADAERIARLFLSLYDVPLPTIAAVQGPAIAGGTGLAMICDFTLATPAARFGFTETRIGFVPALVSAFLSLQLGDKRCRDLLLTARIFDAEEAHRLGLVNEVVAPEALSARIRELAKTLSANSPEALTSTKRLLTAQNRGWLDAAMIAALDANAEARRTDDFKEGVAAFLEKRKPNWQK